MAPARLALGRTTVDRPDRSTLGGRVALLVPPDRPESSQPEDTRASIVDLFRWLAGYFATTSDSVSAQALTIAQRHSREAVALIDLAEIIDSFAARDRHFRYQLMSRLTRIDYLLADRNDRNGRSPKPG